MYLFNYFEAPCELIRVHFHGHKQTKTFIVRTQMRFVSVTTRMSLVIQHAFTINISPSNLVGVVYTATVVKTAP